MLKQTVKVQVGAELDPACRAEGRVGSDGDAKVLAQVDERLLGEVGVDLDLQDSGLNFGVAEEIDQDGSREVAACTCERISDRRIIPLT